MSNDKNRREIFRGSVLTVGIVLAVAVSCARGEDRGRTE